MKPTNALELSLMYLKLLHVEVTMLHCTDHESNSNCTKTAVTFGTIPLKFYGTGLGSKFSSYERSHCMCVVLPKTRILSLY